MALPPNASDSAPISEFSVFEGTTRLVQLDSEEQIWAGLNRRCRRYIKKAEGAGAEVMDLGDFEILPKYFGWVQTTYTRAGEAVPAPLDFYRALRDLVWPKGWLLLRGTFVDDRPGTVEIFGLFNDWLYAVDSAMDREMEVEGMGNLLTWDTMRQACRRGAKNFDMLGTSIPRIAEYKQSFGGETRLALQLELSTGAFRMAKGLIGLYERRRL